MLTNETVTIPRPPPNVAVVDARGVCVPLSSRQVIVDARSYAEDESVLR